jgi:copper chaperone CopZ
MKEVVMETIYTVSGLSCENCVKHVLEEVREIPGVVQAELDLSGQLTLVTELPLDVALVQEATSEAGNYQVSLASH